eukprot:UN30045
MLEEVLSDSSVVSLPNGISSPVIERIAKEGHTIMDAASSVIKNSSLILDEEFLCSQIKELDEERMKIKKILNKHGIGRQIEDSGTLILVYAGLCTDCNRSVNTYVCNQCDDTFCNNCESWYICSNCSKSYCSFCTNSSTENNVCPCTQTKDKGKK